MLCAFFCGFFCLFLVFSSHRATAHCKYTTGLFVPVEDYSSAVLSFERRNAFQMVPCKDGIYYL